MNSRHLRLLAFLITLSVVLIVVYLNTEEAGSTVLGPRGGEDIQNTTQILLTLKEQLKNCNSTTHTELDDIIKGQQQLQSKNKDEKVKIFQNNKGTVVILTPLKNCVQHLPGYFDRIQSLKYPKELTSLAFLVSDSPDGTYDKLVSLAEKVKHLYASITVIQKDYGLQLFGESRHGLGMQVSRRNVLSKSRNYLLQVGLKDQEWVVWLDVDVESYPATIISDLMAYDKDIIIPNCLVNSGGRYHHYDLSSWRDTEKSREYLASLPHDQVVFEGYAEFQTHRENLNFIYLNKITKENLIKIDGIGGTFILVKSDVHRSGANFPAFPVKHSIETEGFAQMALLLGFEVYGLPQYLIFHG